MSLVGMVCVAAVALAFVITLGVMRRRRNLYALKWPRTMSWLNFQRRCVRYLQHSGCVVIEPNKPTSLVKRNGVNLFVLCVTKTPNNVELKALEFNIERFRRIRDDFGGLIIYSGEVDTETAYKIDGKYIKRINYRELVDLDEVFSLRIAERPKLEPVPKPSTKAWDILNQ